MYRRRSVRRACWAAMSAVALGWAAPSSPGQTPAPRLLDGTPICPLSAQALLPGGQPAPFALDELTRLGLNRNPKLAQAGFAVTTQRRVAILSEVVKLAEQSVELTRKLLEAKHAARLDLIQLEVDPERLKAEEVATRRGTRPAETGEEDIPKPRIFATR